MCGTMRDYQSLSLVLLLDLREGDSINVRLFKSMSRSYQVRCLEQGRPGSGQKRLLSMIEEEVAARSKGRKLRLWLN